MAEDDDDYLDLCDDRSSPLPVPGISGTEDENTSTLLTDSADVNSQIQLKHSDDENMAILQTNRDTGVEKEKSSPNLDSSNNTPKYVTISSADNESDGLKDYSDIEIDESDDTTKQTKNLNSVSPEIETDHSSSENLSAFICRRRKMKSKKKLLAKSRVDDNASCSDNDGYSSDDIIVFTSENDSNVVSKEQRFRTPINDSSSTESGKNSIKKRFSEDDSNDKYPTKKRKAAESEGKIVCGIKPNFGAISRSKRTAVADDIDQPDDIVHVQPQKKKKGIDFVGNIKHINSPDAITDSKTNEGSMKGKKDLTIFCGDQPSNSLKMKSSNSVTTISAIKLKEMYPDLSAFEIGCSIRDVYDGEMSEHQLVQLVVENMYNEASSTTDVQIAIANPKIQIMQCNQSVSHAKNQMVNSTKGKSLAKKRKREDTEVDMECHADDSGYHDFESMDINVSKLEAKLVKPGMIKLCWNAATQSEKNNRYTIEMQTAPFSKWTMVAKEVAGTVYMVQNLDTEEDHKFRVFARTRFGDISEPSPIVHVSKSDLDMEVSRPAVMKSPKKVEEDSVTEVSSSTLTCEGCKTLTSCDKIVQCCDGHLNCSVCVEKVVKKVLSVGNEEVHISCSVDDCIKCDSYIPESQAKKVLPSLVFELLEDKMNKKASETIEKMTDLYSCPSCQYKLFIEGDLQKFVCPGCKVTTCRYCGKTWDSSSTDHKECSLNTVMATSNTDETQPILDALPEGYKDFEAVLVQPDRQSDLTEYNFVLTLFHSKKAGLIGKKINNLFTPVGRIFKIRNPKLWQKYNLAKQHMIQDIGQDYINEQHLFHGTRTNGITGICREGLDWRMCGTNGTAFGQGTYFARNSNYSLRYSVNCGNATFAKPRGNNAVFNFGPSNSSFTFGNSSVPSYNPPSTGHGFHFGPKPATNMTTTAIQLHNILSNNAIPMGYPNFSDVNLSENSIPLEEKFLDIKKRYMFLARVLVGRTCRGDPSMRKPPRDEYNRSYNSSCDNPSLPSIFVIYDSAQCYPEYLIELD